MIYFFVALTFFGALSFFPVTSFAADKIVCIDDVSDNGRGNTEASVAEEGGRLTLSIFNVSGTERRLIAREGVAKRPNNGREFDVLYIGPNAKLGVNTTTGAGQLKATSIQSSRPLAMICDLLP